MDLTTHFLPEGRLLHTEENRRLCATAEGLSRAMETGTILEGTALLCDENHSLKVSVGPFTGYIPRQDTALGIAEGTTRDIAILSRVGKPVSFTVEALEGEDGLMEGDIFYKIDGWRTYLRGDASLLLQFNDGKGVDMEVIRDGERVVLKDLPLYRGTYDGQEGRFGLMVGAARVPATFFNTVKFIGYQTLDFVQQVWFSLIQLFRGSVGLSEVSGPVGIVSTMTEVGNASKTAMDAVENIAFFGALIAINLAVMNLLPIPALDGGRIFFLAVDALSLGLFKRKVPEKYQAAMNAACFILLMGVMLLVTLKDVGQLFMRGGS